MKLSKLLALLFVLVLVMTIVNAIDYTISGHSIDIQISQTGNDTTIEKFFIEFPNSVAKQLFRNKSMELGTNIDQWKGFDPQFAASLGENTLNKKISYTEGSQNYLELSYDLAEPLMAKDKETNMVTEYVIKVNYFNKFYQAGLWIIPDKTTISVELPPGAEVRDEIEPQGVITTNGSRKTVSWEGYKSGNKLTLDYILWKKIDPVIDINAMTAFLFKTQIGLLLCGIIAAIITILVIKRKKIAEAIEEFVEKNSLIQEE